MSKIVQIYRSIYTRLFIGFILLMLPFEAAGFLMINWGQSVIREHIESSVSRDISAMTSNLESEIERIQLLEFQTLNDNNLNSFLNNYNYMKVAEYYISARDVRSRLVILKNSNILIDDVEISILGKHDKITAQEGYRSFDSQKVDTQIYNVLNSKESFIIDETGQIYMGKVYPMTARSIDEVIAFLCITLSEEQAQKYLSRFSTENNDGNSTAFYQNYYQSWIMGAGNSFTEEEKQELFQLGKDATVNRKTITLDGKQYYVSAAYSSLLDGYFIKYIPLDDIFKIPQTYRDILIIFSFISIIVIGGYAGMTYRNVKHPVDEMVAAFKKVQDGDLGVRLDDQGSYEFNMMTSGFNDMVSRIQDLIDREYRLKIYTQRVELKQLQSQINPHFLYNSFFMLQRMIQDEDIEEASELTQYLGQYFRFITRSGEDKVTLEKELEHARSYIEIQLMRFSGRFKIDFEKIPEKYRQYRVPRLIVQPILENALEYGINSMEKNGIIKMHFQEIENGLQIIVEDNGRLLTDEKLEEMRDKLKNGEGENTGIFNIHKRLHLEYGGKSGLILSRSSLGGFKVIMQIKGKGNSL